MWGSLNVFEKEMLESLIFFLLKNRIFEILKLTFQEKDGDTVIVVWRKAILLSKQV